jgi:hypothetical protein
MQNKKIVELPLLMMVVATVILLLATVLLLSPSHPYAWEVLHTTILIMAVALW